MNATPDMYARLIRLDELARVLCMRQAWLQELAEAGVIPSILPKGGTLRFNLRAVQDTLLTLAATATGHVDTAAAAPGRGGLQPVLGITAAAGGRKGARHGR